jgi:subtilisin-like proprotein convertase family protein
MTVFDPRATRHLNDSSNPFDGSYLQISDSVPLTVFNGEQLKGTWRLVVTDFVPSLPTTTGSITCFQVTAKYKTG